MTHSRQQQMFVDLLVKLMRLIKRSNGDLKVDIIQNVMKYLANKNNDKYEQK